MSAIRFALTGAAQGDIDAIIDHYRLTAGADVASRFLDSLDAAKRTLMLNPAIGARQEGLPRRQGEIRRWPLHSFPHRLFYQHDRRQILLLRVLHSARNWPALLTED